MHERESGVATLTEDRVREIVREERATVASFKPNDEFWKRSWSISPDQSSTGPAGCAANIAK